MPLRAGRTQCHDSRRSENARFDNPQGATTATALEFRAGPEPSDGTIGIDAEQDLQQTNQPFAIGVQKAEVAGASEAFGQNMTEHQPQKLHAG